MIKPAPFDTDSDAIKEREDCDYSIKITMGMARDGTAPRKIRLFTDGIYDLFHHGHARQLMQCKNVFPASQVHLLVGCCSDELTKSMKGQTVMFEDERYESLRHCRYVDEVIRNSPWIVDTSFMEKHKIDFVAHDELPYTTGSEEDVYKMVKDNGMFVPTERTKGVSTSDVITRILKNYDVYLKRNLARGYTEEDLNISFLKGQWLKLQDKMDRMRKSGAGFFKRLLKGSKKQGPSPSKNTEKVDPSKTKTEKTKSKETKSRAKCQVNCKGL